MKKQSREILQYLDGKSEITVPMLQKDLELSYDEARAKMSELENDGLVSYKGGVVYVVDPKRVAGASKDEDKYAYHDRPKEDIFERLKHIEINNFNDGHDEAADEDDNGQQSYDDDEDFYLSDEDDEDDKDYEDDNELAELFDIISDDRDDEDDEETVDEDMSVFLSHDLMPYKPKQVYYDIIREVYDDKQEVPPLIMSKDLVSLFQTSLGEGFVFDEKRTERAGWVKAFFTSQLYLPDGDLYAPILTYDENEDYCLQQKLIDPVDEGKLCVRQEFYMLLKRHDMIFGDCMLAKQFSNVSDAVATAMELYGALCEAKMLLDVI